MKVPTRTLPSPGILVAAIVLTVALAGTSIAADPLAKLSKAKVRSIANKEIDKRAPGLSVDEATFAITAGNSERLGNLDPSAFMRSSGCARGKVLGFARFDGAAMSAQPTYSTAGVSVAENCSGGSVEASRVATGDYRIRFNGLDAVLAVCSSLADGEFYPLTYISTSLLSPGNWRLAQVDGFNDMLVNGTFTCVVV